MNNDYAKRIAEAVIEAAAIKAERSVTRDEAAEHIRSLDLDAIIASEAPADQPAPGVNQEAPGVSSGGKWQPEWMTPEMMRAVQLNSELGAYAAANLSGAYNLFQEFWKVGMQAAKRDALTQAPQERVAVMPWYERKANDRATLHPVTVHMQAEIDELRALLSLAQSSEGEKP